MLLSMVGKAEKGYDNHKWEAIHTFPVICYSIATYCVEQFSGAFCFHNFMYDHCNGPLGVELDDLLCLYCFLFLLQTVSTPAVCKYWIKK